MHARSGVSGAIWERGGGVPQPSVRAMHAQLQLQQQRVDRGVHACAVCMCVPPGMHVCQACMCARLAVVRQGWQQRRREYEHCSVYQAGRGHGTALRHHRLRAARSATPQCSCSRRDAGAGRVSAGGVRPGNPKHANVPLPAGEGMPDPACDPNP